MEALNQPPASLDQALKNLIQEALAFPATSHQRQKRLERIYTLVMQSKKLWRDSSPFYADAVNDMWHECLTNLEDYDPSLQQVTTWLNDSLRRALRRYKDRHQRDLKRHRTQVIDAEGQETRIVEILPSRPDAVEVEKAILAPVLQWVETDADGKLRSCIFRKRPEINAQAIILRRIPPQCQDWPAIWAEFKLSGKEARALPGWYHRSCKPFLREFGENSGLL